MHRSQRDRGTKRRAEDIALRHFQVVEQAEEVFNKILMGIVAQPGAVASAGGQVEGDAAEVLGQPGDRLHKGQPAVGKTGHEDQRRPRAPREVGTAITTGEEDAAHRLLTEATTYIGQRERSGPQAGSAALHGTGSCLTH